ncbi:IS5-like element ISPha2 family transposase [Tropicimonas sp. TH_r6]|uniref:IS5-like element ISPha2 family transposase n=1 Tax=Tropicimonas sp. TH_r6 TaxID=3082085 RepID=UPI0029534DA1|nr:IS5-like element ISPha2 family transposase [Tropicimonas sp. TH_r6]MDV7143030.1 IS5-like element ISPha2 family transposase [Tropicimonas sp. TH_r6]
MRGTDEASESLFSYVDLEERIPAGHPLHKIRQIVNDALTSLDAEFDALYTDFGRPSIAPERLIRASLLQILFSIRSERQLMEQMDYNLLFRWFVGLGIDDPVWVPTVFSKNRDRLLTTDMSRKVMAAILAHPQVKPLLSDEHFSVDGTLVKAWASMKSFQPKEGTAPPQNDDPSGPPSPPADETSPDTDQAQQTETQPMTNTPRQTRNPEVNFRGQKRSNATHASVTDPDARLYKKAPGAAAMLCFMGHTLMENRNGLVVQAELTHAEGYGERKAALEMINRHSPGSTRRLTLGADKGYDSADFVADLRRMVVTPHVAQKARHSAIDGRTTRHLGYALSQRRRKKIEEPFGWAKTVGGMSQTVHRGLDRVCAQFTMTMAACNLARLPKLLAA